MAAAAASSDASCDLDHALGQDEHRAAGLALADQLLARSQVAHLHAPAELGKLLRLERPGEQIDLPEQSEPRRGRRPILGTLRHAGVEDVLLRIGGLDPGGGQMVENRLQHVAARGRGRHLAHPDVVADPVFDAARGDIADQHARGRLADRAARADRGHDPAEQQAHRAIGRDAEIERHRDVEAREAIGLRVVGRHEHAHQIVRDDDRLGVLALDPGGPPVDVDDPAADRLLEVAVMDLDPVVDLIGAVEVDREAGEDVEDDVSQRQADHQGHDARGGEEAGQRIAEDVGKDAAESRHEDDQRERVPHQPRHRPAEPAPGQLIPEQSVDQPADGPGAREPERGRDRVIEQRAPTAAAGAGERGPDRGAIDREPGERSEQQAGCPQSPDHSRHHAAAPPRSARAGTVIDPGTRDQHRRRSDRPGIAMPAARSVSAARGGGTTLPVSRWP